MKTTLRHRDRARLSRYATIAFVIAIFPAGLRAASAQTTGTCERGTATADLDIGNVRARMFNHGGLFWTGSGSGDPLYEVPKGGGANAIFASGIWVGGLVDGDLRVAGATYSHWEFWPGPLDEQGNPPADCTTFDRIFVVDRGALEHLNATGEPSDDIRDWPWELGAPVVDGDGNPDNYDLAAGDRPAILGDQMAWWIMNDAGSRHDNTETDPIGLEVQVSAFAFERDDAVGNTTFYRYRLAYHGARPMDETYLGFWSDVDLGYAGDDFVGSDSLRGLGFAYNGDDFDGGLLSSETSRSVYGYPPPAIGYDILRGPVADRDGLDNDFDGLLDEPNERHSMTAFVAYALDRNVFPTRAEHYYGYLKAEWRDGVRITIGGTGRGFSKKETNFMFPAHPPAFWSEDNIDDEGQRNWPSDRRFVSATGPFTLNRGDTEDVWLAIIWSRGTDRLDSVRQLKDDSDFIQAFFDTGFTAASLEPPAIAPTPVAPSDGTLGQPVNPTFRWTVIPGVNRYELQIDNDRLFDSPLVAVSTTQAAVTIEEPLPLNTRVFWRVRAVNRAGPGPWSESRTLATGTGVTTPGDGGLLRIDDEFMFVEVSGPDDRYACGPLAESRFGCEEVGGNHVYGSLNGAGDYIMFHEGTGPEGTLAPYAPHSYEVRFTETGSYAYHWFTTEAVVWVPFEVWDIGTEYTGTDINPNDTADDIRMVPILFSAGRDACNYGYYDDPNLVPFGTWSGSTMRIYAYYPTTTYANYEAYVKPLVDATPCVSSNGEVNSGAIVGDISDRGSPALVDIRRGRPLQRIIFEGDPSQDPPHPVFGVVVRFYTKEPIPPSVPILSAPRESAVGLGVPITLAWNTVSDDHRVQVADNPGFDDLLIDATTPADFYRIQSLPNPGTYYWRVRATDDGVTSDWSRTASFSASLVVSNENETGLPLRFALEQNYPNPFNPSTTIPFALPTAEHVTLEVYDLIGRRVAQLVDATLPPGNHEARWNATAFASGMYLYRIRAGSYRDAKTMLLVR